MHTSNAPMALAPSQSVTREDLLALGKLCDEQAQAISFYFSLSDSPDNSHREEVITIKKLVRDAIGHCQPGAETAGLLKDLVAILAAAEEIRCIPSRLRAIFACSDQHIWQEFDLPVSGSISRLGVGRYFDLAPLLAALESCSPYKVVLVEHGKARGFAVRGTEIREVPERFPAENVGLHGDDPRVGWSHHISDDLEEHAKAYEKHLAAQLQSFMAVQACERLVVGCREDLWSQIEPLLRGPERAAWIGRFHLPNFDVSAADVLRAATPVFDEYQKRRYLDLVQQIQEASLHSAFGLDDVLQSLHQGRVQKLVLGKASDQVVFECKACGRSQAGFGNGCPFCGSAELYPVRAQEALIRRALLTDAEILLPGQESYALDDVAALLRY